MNELSKVRRYIIDMFDADPLVNTITTLSEELIDTNKETIYPVVNIDYLDSDVLEDVVLFSFKITALDQNDVYTKTTDSKLLCCTNSHQRL